MSNNPVHVLLVEDDAGLARLCRRHLESSGYVVDHASDGNQGLAMYDPNIHDVLVLDNELPVYDGLEVIRRLILRGSLPPIVMVTGSGNEQIAVEAMRLGAQDYLVKDTDGGYLNLLPTIMERAIRLRRGEEYMRMAAKVFESAAEGIGVTDMQATILSVNAAFTTITGWQTGEIIGKHPAFLLAGQQNEELFRVMGTSLEAQGEWQGEIWARRRNGEAFPVWLTISAVKDEQGRTSEYTGVFMDITSRKRAEEHLRHLATHDPLTGLPNRDLFWDRLNQALALGRRNKRQIAVLMMDLDHFKQINDTRGHAAGDLLLQEVGKRLTRCMRDCDTVARIGGDEFNFLLAELSDAQAAARIAERIIEEMARPFLLDGYECTVGASIGISFYPAQGDTPEELLKTADSAMYRAKTRRNCFEFAA